MKVRKTKDQILNERLDRSYAAYIKNRRKWEDKGYFMAEPISRKDYKYYYEDGKNRGMKNIARTLAHDDIGITYSRARKLMSHINENEVLKEKFKDFNVTTLTSNSMRAHDVISEMYSLGLIENREDFEKSLGY